MTRSALAGLLVLGAGVVPSAALASDYEPPVLSSVRLSLEEALLIGLENAPDVWLAEESIRQRTGALQTASGLFDPIFFFTTSASHQEGELLLGALEAQQDRRRTLQLIADSLDQAATQLEDQFGDQLSGVVQCPDEVIFEVNDQQVCVTAEDVQRAENINRILRGLGILLEIEDVLFTTPNLLVRQVIDTIQQFRQVEAELRAQQRDLGEIPSTEVENTLTFDLSLTKPFRNGTTLSALMILESREDNFEDKPLFRVFERSDPLTGSLFVDPATGLPFTSFDLSRFGGKAVPNTFTSSIGFTYNAPLGRGGGRKSAQAAERAGELDLDAAVESRKHTSSLVALDVLLDYWNLVAAQQRLAVIERSRENRERVDESVGRLIEGEEIPAIERARTRANLAQVLASEAQAEQALTQARLRLAGTLGVRVASIDQAPLAAEGFPQVPESVGVHGVLDMIDSVLQQRNDYRSSRLRTQALQVLEEAARRDLLPVFDLTFEVGVASLLESPNTGNRDAACRVPAPPPGCADISVIRWFDPEGHIEALFDEYAGPSARLTLTLDLPFKNRRQRGRYLQSKSRRREAEIRERDLARTISASVVDLAAEVEEAVRNVNELEESVEAFREALDGDLRLFQAGEVTVIDTLLTEEQLTSAEQALISARQTYATLLARLRFEVGALVRFEEVDGSLEETVHPYDYDFGL